MKEISDRQILIGLSKEEVEEKLGKPGYSFNDKSGSVHVYNAGKLDTGTFLGDTTSFDENNKVDHTSIHTND